VSVTQSRSLLWLAIAAWAGVIFFMSSLPGSSLPPRIPPQIGHLGEYFILGSLLYMALRIDLPPRRALLLAVLLASAYGVTDEFHQRFVATRTPDVWDWATDTLGALAGAGLTHVILARASRRRSA